LDVPDIAQDTGAANVLVLLLFGSQT